MPLWAPFLNCISDIIVCVLCASLLGCPRSGEGAVPGEEMGLARGAVNGIRQTRHGITTRGQVCCVQRGRTKKGE